MTVTCLIAHIDHGKTTLLDCLLAFHKFMSTRNTGIKLLDTRDDEQIRGITLKLSFIKLVNKIGKIPFYFIDTPGHFDIESYLEAAMFLSDSTLILIDLQEGLTPRCISLLRFASNRSILFLNKIDKLLNILSIEDIYAEIINIIETCNGILKENIFEYEKNNIIIGSSLNRYAFNIKSIKKIVNKEMNLKNSLKFFYCIKVEVDKNNKEKIFSKFQINNWWNVLGEIFPLAECVFHSINDICNLNIFESKDCLFNFSNKNLEKSLKCLSISSEGSYNNNFARNDSIGVAEKGLKNFLEFSFKNIDLLEKYNEKIKTFFGFTTTAVNLNGGFNGDPIVLFAVKPFRILKVNDWIYSETEKELKQTKIKNIYKLEGMEFIKCDLFDEPKGICFVEADFLKKSFLFAEPIYAEGEKRENSKLMRIKNILQFIKQPFYHYTLIPISPIPLFVERIKRLSLTENLLKAKINKFGEIEMLLEGKIHLEKLLYDLKDLKYEEGKLRDKTLPSVKNEIEFRTEKYFIKISEIPIDFDDVLNEIRLNKSVEEFYNEKIELELKNRKEKYNSDKNFFIKRVGNFICESTYFNDLSVLMYSLPSLYNVIVHIEKFCDFEFDEILKNIRNLLTQNVEYRMFYELGLFIDPSHVGILYQSMHKYGYTLLGEEVDNNFLVIKVLIQKKVFNNLRDDVINRMKGQVAMTIKEVGYLKNIVD